MAPGGQVDQKVWRSHEDNAWRQARRPVFPTPRMRVANNSPFGDIRNMVMEGLK